MLLPVLVFAKKRDLVEFQTTKSFLCFCFLFALRILPFVAEGAKGPSLFCRVLQSRCDDRLCLFQGGTVCPKVVFRTRGGDIDDGILRQRKVRGLIRSFRLLRLFRSGFLIPQYNARGLHGTTLFSFFDSDGDDEEKRNEKDRDHAKILYPEPLHTFSLLLFPFVYYSTKKSFCQIHGKSVENS